MPPPTKTISRPDVEAVPAAGWPSAVPELAEAILLLKGEAAPPAALKAVTEQLAASLSFQERAALFEAEPSAGSTVLVQVAATRWRIAAALALRPTNGEPPDSGALDQLIGDIDTTLAQLGELGQTDDEELRAACEAARKSLARGIGQLLPTTSAESAKSVDAIERARRSEVEQTLAKASSTVRVKQDFGPSGPKGRGKRIAALICGVVATGLLAFAAFSLIPESEKSVPTLPLPPPGTELLGNPRAGSVILSSTDGKPLSREAVEKFTAEARAAGAEVQPLGPTQLLLKAR
jgi:hypothetical protein